MLSEPKDGYIFEAPKFGKGRNIRLTQWATAALRVHRKRQLEERMHQATLKRAGLPKSTRFHDLRYAPAEAGRESQVRAGDFGARRYKPHPQVCSHVLPDMGDAATGAMDVALD